MWRVVVVFLISLLFIGLHFKKKKDVKKSLFALALLIYIFSIGYSGSILTRPIPPLFFIHLVSLVLAYIGFLLYLIKDKFLWYLLLLPVASVAIYFVLNYIDGSRYEALNTIAHHFV